MAAIGGFNRTIAEDAAAAGMPVAGYPCADEQMAAHPPMIGDVPPLRYNGGPVSPRRVHPSDIGHAPIANAFIR